MIIQQNQASSEGQSGDGVFEAQCLDILEEIEIGAGPTYQGCFQVEVQAALGNKLAAFRLS